VDGPTPRHRALACQVGRRRKSSSVNLSSGASGAVMSQPISASFTPATVRGRCNGPDGLEGPNPWHKPSKVGKNHQATLPHRQWVGWPVSALYLTPGAEPRSGSAGPGVNDSGLVFPVGCVQRESKPASSRVPRCRVDFNADGASEDLRPSHSGRSRPVHHVPRGQFEQAPPAAVRLAVQTEDERHSIRGRHALDLFGNDCDRDPIGHEAHATP
jgi:hypothetical protein